MNKSINKDVISERTRSNRQSAIETILLDEAPANKAIKNIINSAQEQILNCDFLKNIMVKSSMNFEEIYNLLGMYKRGIIPVIIAFLIKKHIDFIVIRKQGTEVDINSSLVEDIDKEPYLYTLDIIEDKCFCEYKDIFYSERKSNNIFANIVEGMQNWFFNLDKYVMETSKEYVGSGNYKEISKEIIEFKNSLKIIPKEPYWYLSNRLPSIFGNNVYKKMLFQKNMVENTLPRLINNLGNDIKEVFPETLEVWYKQLPDSLKKRIFKDGEEYFLKLCRLDIKEEKVEKIAKYLTGISINDWSEDTPSLFFEKLQWIRKSIESKENEGTNNGFIIKFINQGVEGSEKYVDASSNIKSSTKDLYVNDIKCLLDDYRGCIKYADRISLLFQAVLEGKI